MNLLLVDDDAGFRQALCQVLQCAGWVIREAAGGYEALQILRRQPADMILTDLFMPDGDGFELLSRARVCRPDVKVIVMSGGGSIGLIDEWHLDFAKSLVGSDIDEEASLA